MSYKHVLDTFAWSELFDGTEKGLHVRQILEEEGAATSIIALAEISDKLHREARKLEPFVEYMKAKAAILPLTQEIALKSGKLKTELRKVSKNVSLADAIHFQTAKTVGAEFVTGDADFESMKNGKGILFL